MQARTRVSSRVSLGLAGQLCITHVGYYRAGPVPVIRRGLVEQEFAWRARWPRGSVPCRRAVGRGGRTVGFGGVLPEIDLRSTPARHSGTPDEGTGAAKLRAYSRRRESGFCCRATDPSVPSLTKRHLWDPENPVRSVAGRSSRPRLARRSNPNDW